MTDKEKKLKGIRLGINIIVTTLVEMFTSAATKGLMHDVEGNKMAKLGARAGAFLTGLYVGDKVSDYICDNVDEMLSSYEEIEAEIREE